MRALPGYDVGTGNGVVGQVPCISERKPIQPASTRQTLARPEIHRAIGPTTLNRAGSVNPNPTGLGTTDADQAGNSRTTGRTTLNRTGSVKPQSNRPRHDRRWPGRKSPGRPDGRRPTQPDRVCQTQSNRPRFDVAVMARRFQEERLDVAPPVRAVPRNGLWSDKGKVRRGLGWIDVAPGGTGRRDLRHPLWGVGPFGWSGATSLRWNGAKASTRSFMQVIHEGGPPVGMPGGDSEIAEPSFVVRRSRDAASTMKAWSRCVRLYEWHLRKLKELKWSATRSGFGFAMLGPSVQP